MGWPKWNRRSAINNETCDGALQSVTEDLELSLAVPTELLDMEESERLSAVIRLSRMGLQGFQLAAEMTPDTGTAPLTLIGRAAGWGQYKSGGIPAGSGLKAYVGFPRELGDEPPYVQITPHLSGTSPDSRYVAYERVSGTDRVDESYWREWALFVNPDTTYFADGSASFEELGAFYRDERTVAERFSFNMRDARMGRCFIMAICDRNLYEVFSDLDGTAYDHARQTMSLADDPVNRLQSLMRLDSQQV